MLDAFGLKFILISHFVFKKKLCCVWHKIHYVHFSILVFVLLQGGHKPGKQGKPGKLREFEKLSKSQGNSGKFELL